MMAIERNRRKQEKSIQLRPHEAFRQVEQSGSVMADFLTDTRLCNGDGSTLGVMAYCKKYQPQIELKMPSIDGKESLSRHNKLTCSDMCLANVASADEYLPVIRAWLRYYSLL